MKRILTYSILAALILFSACRKTDNPNLPALERVPVPSVTVDPVAGDISISATNPASFKGVFVVDLFYKSDIKPTKMDVVVIKNGIPSSVKMFSAGLTTFPTTLTVTGTQLTTLFGSVPVLGDQYDFGVDIYTQSGLKYEAFPLSGAAAYGGPGPSTQTGGVSLFATYKVLCLFTASEFAGNFKVTVDGWNDYGVNSIIPVAVEDATHLSIQSVNGKKLIMTIKPNNDIQVLPQNIGDYKVSGVDPTWIYGNVTATSDPAPGGGKNFISPCVHTIDLNLAYTVSAGGFGSYILELVKQ